MKKNKLPNTLLNEVKKESKYVAIVNVSDFKPIESFTSLNKLMTCGSKGTKERFYFLTELEQIIPPHFIRNFETEKTIYLVKENQLTA